MRTVDRLTTANLLEKKQELLDVRHEFLERLRTAVNNVSLAERQNECSHENIKKKGEEHTCTTCSFVW